METTQCMSENCFLPMLAMFISYATSGAYNEHSHGLANFNYNEKDSYPHHAPDSTFHSCSPYALWIW